MPKKSKEKAITKTRKQKKTRRKAIDLAFSSCFLLFLVFS